MKFSMLSQPPMQTPRRRTGSPLGVRSAAPSVRITAEEEADIGTPFANIPGTERNLHRLRSFLGLCQWVPMGHLGTHGGRFAWQFRKDPCNLRSHDHKVAMKDCL